MKKITVLYLTAIIFTASFVYADVKVKITHTHRRTTGPVLAMNNGRMSYDIALRVKEDGKFDSNNFTLEGFGLFPSKRGWSGLYDFFVILFDGKKILPAPFSIKQMNSGEEGSAVLLGTAEAADIKITFFTEPKSDNLMISLEFKLKQDVKEISIRMQAFPGEFNKIAIRKKLPLGPVETVVMTAKEESKARRRLLDLKTESWLCMYDENYDPIKNKDLGGSEMCACGVLFNPKDMKSVAYKRAPGAVLVNFQMKGGNSGEKISTDFAVWEFMNSNKIAKETMKALVVSND